MSTTHTQGPWFTHYEGAVLHVIPCTHPTAGTVQICTANGTAHRAKSETEANFRLIATAPELLAALEALVGEADLGEVDLDDDDRIKLDNARAAIAKAKGTK